MNGSQTVVAGGGLALIGANFWTRQRGTVKAGALTSSASSDAQHAAHVQLVQVAVELAFVAVATLVAGMNGAAGGAMVAMILALGVLFLINQQKGKK